MSRLTRDDIVAGAGRRFASHGYHGTSMRDLGDDLGILIGRRGQTLLALQYVLNLILSRRINRRVAFGVDVDGYRQRREEALVGLAQRSASRVRSTGKSVTLEPMPANERRIVHITLAEDESVVTVSIGEGESRKVAITPAE